MGDTIYRSCLRSAVKAYIGGSVQPMKSFSTGAALGNGQTVTVSDGTNTVNATWNATNSDYEASVTESATGSVTLTATVNGTTITQTAQTTVS